MPGERAQSGRAETRGYRRPGYPVGGLSATMATWGDLCGRPVIPL